MCTAFTVSSRVLLVCKEVIVEESETDEVGGIKSEGGGDWWRAIEVEDSADDDGSVSKDDPCGSIGVRSMVAGDEGISEDLRE